MNVVTWTFGRFVGYVSLEISRCCGKSILMKVTDIVITITSKNDTKQSSDAA